jgi:hypothetical protein
MICSHATLEGNELLPAGNGRLRLMRERRRAGICNLQLMKHSDKTGGDREKYASQRGLIFNMDGQYSTVAHITKAT